MVSSDKIKYSQICNLYKQILSKHCLRAWSRTFSFWSFVSIFLHICSLCGGMLSSKHVGFWIMGWFHLCWSWNSGSIGLEALVRSTTNIYFSLGVHGIFCIKCCLYHHNVKWNLFREQQVILNILHISLIPLVKETQRTES